MTLPKQSSWEWLAIAALLLLGSRRKRKPGSKREPVPPGGHRIPDVLSLPQLRELATAVGMADPITGAAIAMAESGGQAKAVKNHGDSIGLWQIHVPSAPKAYANRDMLKHPGKNAEAALAMSNGGTAWEYWPSFRSGAYKRWMTP